MGVLSERTLVSLCVVLGVVTTGATAYALTTGCAETAADSRGTTAAQYTGATPITLVNDTGAPIDNVQMGPSSDGAWGDNWLAAGEILMPGSERTFMTRGDAAWDVRVYAQGAPSAPLRTAMHVTAAGARISLNTMTVIGASSGGSRAPSGTRSGPGGSLY